MPAPSPSCAVSRSRSRAQAQLALIGVLFGVTAQAHDLIDADSAERYLAQASRELAVIQSTQRPQARADASYALGRMLDEIRDLLNRDVAAHGRIQGLATEYLVRELAKKGLALEVKSGLGRYPANIAFYRQALKSSPDAPHAADAMFAWLQGAFYDSFDADPLQPRAQPWGELLEQIALAERLVKRAPAYPDIEEAKFILAVLYTRAARSAPDRKLAAQYAERARTGARDFQSLYPDSLRTAAMPVLLEALPR